MKPEDVFKAYRGNLTWLPQRTIFVAKHGSHAYGTNGPDSDVDLKGVVVPPPEYFLGFVDNIEQVDKGFEGLDCCLYTLRRFMELASDCNPNMIEIPFLDEADWVLATDEWRRVVAARDSLLSTNAKNRFCGYAIAQLKRIETHRRWLLHPPDHKPTRSEYGLPDYNVIPKEQREALEAMMQKVVEGWQVDLACLDDGTRIDLMNKLAQSLSDMKLSADDQWVAAGNKLGLDAKAMEYLKAERAYRAALSEWTKYQTWLKERNPARAELERLYGYDTKHGMHLVRLMRMAKEILTGQGVIVKRPDADELRAIRFRGAWPYERLIVWAREAEAEVNALVSKLPKTPDRRLLNQVCMDITREWVLR